MAKQVLVIKVLIFSILIFPIFSSCQSMQEMETFKPTSKKVVLQVDSLQSVTIRENNNREIFLNFWENNQLGKLISQTSDTTAVEVSFSVTGNLTLNAQCKLVDTKPVRHGQAYFFDYAGRLTHFYTFYDGILDGPYVFYDEYGKILSKGQYFKGKKVE